MPEQQTIPARHGTATFVPKGSVIKIVNTSGTQVVDTWAFALPEPPEKKTQKEEKAEKDAEEGVEKAKDGEKTDDKDPDKKDAKVEEKNNEPKEEKPEAKKDEPKDEPLAKKDEPKVETKEVAKKPSTPKRKTKKGEMDLPSQEEAEQLTSQMPTDATDASKDATKQQQQQSKTWSSYLPSIRRGGGQKQIEGKKDGEAEKKDDEKAVQEKQKQNSRTWASMIPSGQGFTNYLPSKSVISSIAQAHQRDPNKSFAEQLSDFSKTPVGAASLSALSGSGTASSIYAGYSAYSQASSKSAPMEYLSMPHTRAGTCHMSPRANDTLFSNLREPLLTLIEDSSPGIHDTLMAACDPQRYKGLGVEDWEQHGSCAENLVLALKELNQKAGLKGPKGVGADVTVNAVPAPLNLFMNIPWNEKGDLSFDAPAGKEGDFVRLRAEKDVVVVMSACPQDVLLINAKEPTDAHFVVEEADEDIAPATTTTAKPQHKKKKAAPKASKGTPRKLSAAPDAAADNKKTPATTNGTGTPAGKKPALKRPPPKKLNSGATTTTQATTTKSDTTEGTGKATPVERKKPRKLQQRGSVQAKGAEPKAAESKAAEPKTAESKKEGGEGTTEGKSEGADKKGEEKSAQE